MIAEEDHQTVVQDALARDVPQKPAHLVIHPRRRVQLVVAEAVHPEEAERREFPEGRREVLGHVHDLLAVGLWADAVVHAVLLHHGKVLGGHRVGSEVVVRRWIHEPAERQFIFN